MVPAGKEAKGTTATRVVDAALEAFAASGFEATSLDSLAKTIGVRKQTILYYYSSKDVLLDAVIDRAGEELWGVVAAAVTSAEPGWGRIEAGVRAAFALAGRRPELPGLLRDVSRLGGAHAVRLRARLGPFVDQAVAVLVREMPGSVTSDEASLLLLNAYSMVIGAATEVEVLKGLGVTSTARVLARRRREMLQFFAAALAARTPVLHAQD